MNNYFLKNLLAAYFLCGFSLFAADAPGAQKAKEALPLERVYFARRLPTGPNPELVLPIERQMVPADVSTLYQEKVINRENYLQVGPWLFKDRTQKNNDNIPEALKSLDALKMIYKKIGSSTILVAIISPKSFGTIAEIGYAAGHGGIAVYVFPDPTLTDEEIKDFWFVFQTARTTSHLWKKEHFEYAPSIFPVQTTLLAYEDYLSCIKAPFLK